MTSFSFGSDPELMLVNAKGAYTSATSVIDGSKESKIDLGNGHFAFYDNVLAEVNIRPESGKEAVVDSFRDCFKRLADLIGDYQIRVQASHVYPKSECQHPATQQFGCDPEYNIWMRDQDGYVMRVSPPVAEPNNTFRSAGGHVHIGHETALPWGRPVEIVQLMDVFVGITSLLIDHDPTSPARRKLYGGAGTHRIQPAYGVEYRTLSNFWLASPNLVTTIHDLTSLVVELVAKEQTQNVFDAIDLGSIPGIIISGNKEGAKAVFSAVEKFIPATLKGKVTRQMKPQTYDFYKVWGIKKKGR